MTAESDILGRVRQLVEDEHELRERVRAGEISSENERARLERLEEQLDQCWDLLRQRRARAEAGQDPEESSVRSAEQVERYLQ